MEAESAALGSLRPPRAHLKEVMVNEKGAQEKEQRVGSAFGGVICIETVSIAKDRITKNKVFLPCENVFRFFE